MIMKEYSSPELNVVAMGQTDVICSSKDVMKDDNGKWDE